MRTNKNNIMKYHQQSQSIGNKWLVSFEPSAIWLTHPNKYRPNELWDKWAKMQTRILIKILSKLANAHLYMRFSTRFPKHYSNISKSCNLEIISTIFKSSKILLLPNCQDPKIIERILLGDSFKPSAKTFYYFKNQPANWRELIEDIFKNYNKLSNTELLQNSKHYFPSCNCFCSVEDSDLSILNIDLDQKQITSILQEEANLEGLELITENIP